MTELAVAFENAAHAEPERRTLRSAAVQQAAPQMTELAMALESAAQPAARNPSRPRVRLEPAVVEERRPRSKSRPREPVPESRPRSKSREPLIAPPAAAPPAAAPERRTTRSMDKPSAAPEQPSKEKSAAAPEQPSKEQPSKEQPSKEKPAAPTKAVPDQPAVVPERRVTRSMTKAAPPSVPHRHNHVGAIAPANYAFEHVPGEESDTPEDKSQIITQLQGIIETLSRVSCSCEHDELDELAATIHMLTKIDLPTSLDIEDKRQRQAVFANTLHDTVAQARL